MKIWTPAFFAMDVPTLVQRFDSLLIGGVVTYTVMRIIETHKSRLSLPAKLQEIRMSNYIQRESATIEGTYGRLVRLVDAVQKAYQILKQVSVPVGATREEIGEAWQERWNAELRELSESLTSLKDFYLMNAIYYPEDVLEPVNRVHKLLNIIVNSYIFSIQKKMREEDWKLLQTAEPPPALDTAKILTEELRTRFRALARGEELPDAGKPTKKGRKLFTR